MRAVAVFRVMVEHVDFPPELAFALLVRGVFGFALGSVPKASGRTIHGTPPWRLHTVEDWFIYALLDLAGR